MVSQYPWNGKSILERFTNALESGIEGEKCLWGNVIDTCASIGKAQEKAEVQHLEGRSIGGELKEWRSVDRVEDAREDESTTRIERA